MKIIIIAGGTPPSKKLLTSEITKNSIVIATDSGADCLYKYKIVPNHLIGDLDSINKKALKFMMTNNVSIDAFPCEKDLTDAELALKKTKQFKKHRIATPNATHSARNDNVKEIVFLGAIGGPRKDHFLGALGLLDKCVKLNIHCSLKDDYQTINLVKKSTILHGNSGDLFSLQAFGQPVRGLTITGAKYDLKDYSLKMGDGLTLSNEFKNKKVNIKFKSGKLLLFVFNKN